jgi:hypothetical protein
MRTPVETGKSIDETGFDNSRKAFLSKSVLATGAAFISLTDKSFAEEAVKEANKETLIMKTTAGTMTFEFWPEVRGQVL